MADGKVVIETELDSNGLKNGLNKITKSIKGLAGISLKAATAGITATTVAVTGLVTAASNAYASYEQLVGGVDTLFKDSSKQVQEYADMAYKAAGLSANEYMETVTSFSASLIQSLEGDTQAAAELGNQAIIDMADNANKMGTDISMIQSAYQGFAKQNYTMLDNLKLGYGGTKKEMERLIEHANELKEQMGETGDLSIESFADIVEAIHLVQEELDITGTTAKEADSTIEGSANSMKAAWKNLLIGIADDTQDFDKLIDNFVNSVGTFGKNILPRIQSSIKGVGKLINKLFPEILKQLPKLIDDIIPDMIASASYLMQVILDTISSADFIDAFIKVLQTLVTNVGQLLPNILSFASKMLLYLMQAIIDNADTIIDAFVDAVTLLSENISKFIPSLIDFALQLIIKLGEALISHGDEIVKAVATVIESALNEIGNVIPALQPVIGILEILTDNLDILYPAIMACVGAFVAYKTALKITTLVSAATEAIKGLATAEGIAEVKQKALNLVMSMNPIALIVTAIAALVAAFIYLWNNVEGFKEFWINVWEAIKNAVSSAGEFLSGVGEEFIAFWTEVGQSISDFWIGIWDGIKSAADACWQGIKNIFSSVANFFRSIFSAAWQEVKDVFSTGGQIFMGIVDGITSAFKTIVNAIITGINKVVSIPFNAINGVLNTLRNISILGVKPFTWIGTISVPQIPLLYRGGILEKGQVGYLEGNGAEAVVPLDQNAKWTKKVASDMINALATVSPKSASGNDNMQTNVQVNVILEGGTEKIFKAVVQQDKLYYDSKGHSAFIH